MTDSPTAFSPAHRSLLDTVPLRAGSTIVEETIDYDHDGYALEGHLAYDSSLEGPLPTVVIIHDWTGLREYPKARAQMLARLGYAAFAIDMYGTGVRPTGDAASQEVGKYYGDLALMRARVAAGFERAAAEAIVDESRMAMTGYCFGGSAALEFARTESPLRGVASFHGALISHEPADVAAISSSLLVLTGGADPVVPDEKIVAFQEEMRTRDDLDWQVVTYAGAPHAFTLPETDNYREVADKRSWREFVGFLDEVL